MPYLFFPACTVSPSQGHYTCRISTQKVASTSHYILISMVFVCRQIVADCFWNIDGIENGDALLGAKDCRISEFVD